MISRFAAALNQDIEHDPVLVDSTPSPMLPTGDADRDLIEMPLVSCCRKAPADLVCKVLTELHCPLPHRLMADLDASSRQYLLNHAQAERKPEIQPDSMADHLSRVAVAGITG